jgi:hypothetical protein
MAAPAHDLAYEKLSCAETLARTGTFALQEVDLRLVRL